MSRSTPVCRLKCSKCHKKATFKQRYGDAARTHFDVKVIGKRGDKAVCKCIRCGHEYTSKSRAAIRILGRWIDRNPPVKESMTVQKL